MLYCAFLKKLNQENAHEMANLEGHVPLVAQNWHGHIWLALPEGVYERSMVLGGPYF